MDGGRGMKRNQTENLENKYRKKKNQRLKEYKMNKNKQDDCFWSQFSLC